MYLRVLNDIYSAVEGKVGKEGGWRRRSDGGLDTNVTIFMMFQMKHNVSTGSENGEENFVP